jgi:hypothetical protein
MLSAMAATLGFSCSVMRTSRAHACRRRQLLQVGDGPGTQLAEGIQQDRGRRVQIVAAGHIVGDGGNARVLLQRDADQPGAKRRLDGAQMRHDLAYSAGVRFVQANPLRGRLV